MSAVLVDVSAALRSLASRMHTGYCWKKTPDGPRRIDVPFTAVELNEHVHGIIAYGLCPISPGSSTCRVACLDFDSHKGEVPWERMLDTARNVALCAELDGLQPHLFCSSGGSGIHIYFTWAEPQDAFSVREVLKSALALCELRSGTKGVASGEVEVFPKQNEVKNDGFGSMFILPWAGRSEPLGDFSSWRDSAPVPLRTREERSAASAASRALPTIGRIKSALDAIPNSGAEELSYDEWRNIVFAVHAATEGDDTGLELVHEWSARASKYDSDFINNRVWPFIRSDRDGPTITEGTLFARASTQGWQDPTTADDFEALPAESQHVAGSAAPGTATERFRFIHEREFSQRKPPEFHVQDVIPDADLVVVYGESGSGKTFWTLDAVCSIARGVPWRDKRVKRARVGYIAAEGAGGFRNRLAAYKHEHKLDDMDLYVLADTPSFLDAGHVKEVIKRLREIGPVGIVVIDTLAQVIAGGNENASEDMGKLVLYCRMVRKHTGATVILIHHSGKDAARGARGHSSLKGATDAEVEIVRVEHDRVATVTKQKDGEDGAEFGFKLRQVEIGRNEHGESVTSCVVEHGAAIKNVRAKAVKLGAVEEIVVRVCRDLAGLGVGDERPLYGDVVKSAVDSLPAPEEGARDQRSARVKRAIDSMIGRGLLVSDGKHVWAAESRNEA